MPDATVFAVSAPHKASTRARPNCMAEEGPFDVMMLPSLTTRSAVWMAPASDRAFSKPG